ncbi:MAG: hypothetical protein RL141_129 [Candidatus Parcubacteria bacterium]|jgi:hypothetical protein
MQHIGIRLDDEGGGVLKKFEGKKITIAALFIAANGVFVFMIALLYYTGLVAGEVNIMRWIMRALGSLLIAYGVFKRMKAAYWFALFFSGFLTLFGILSVVALLTLGEMHFFLFTTSVLTACLLFAFVLLFPKRIRAEFK